MIGGFQVFDSHVHTDLSGCADNPPGYTAEIVLRHAKGLGIDGVAFSDHILEPQATLPPELAASFGGRPGLERIETLRRTLAQMNRRGLPEIAVGAEVEAWGAGLFAISRPGRARLDHAVFSANHWQCPGSTAPASDDPADVARHILAKTREAIESGMATSIGHPLLGLNSPHPREVYAEYLRLGLGEVFERAREAGVAFGFSRHLVTHQHLTRGRDDVRAVYRLAVEAGVTLCFETDCHQLWHMSCIVPLIELAKWIGLGPGHFLRGLPGSIVPPSAGS